MRRLIGETGEPSRCWGCGKDNPSGLHLEFFETDEGVETEYTAPADLMGPPGVIHGGVQASILDEVMCMVALVKRGSYVFTGELTVRYVAPVPTEVPILVRAWLAEERKESAFIEGVISLASDHRELTRARGRFFYQPMPVVDG